MSNTIVWILGGLGTAMMLLSAIKDKLPGGAFNFFTTLRKPSALEEPQSVSNAPVPMDATLLELEKRYGIVSKNGKDEELIQWRIDRLARTFHPVEEAVE
jgi:hypothetical protein